MVLEDNIALPGPIILFGSGETSPSGRKVLEMILRALPESPRITLLETPAGFEPNSPQVIGRVGDFISHRLQNFNPQISIVAARRRGSQFSPDNQEIVEPLLQADMILLGPGSPTYAVRQLRGSLAWHNLQARHRLGAALVLASAAVIAVSQYALPVYEIYKVGEDLHWKDGLDLFGSYGIPLVFIPHWNNRDGGDELDTSCCFMGQNRFIRLVEMLPPELTIIGIDEKTALIADPKSGICRVEGLGGVTLIHTGQAHSDASAATELDSNGMEQVVNRRGGHVHRFENGDNFSLGRIGKFQPLQDGEGLPADVWQRAVDIYQHPKTNKDAGEYPPEVLAMVEERQAARQRKDWASADRLRKQLAEIGWEVADTPDGPKITRN